MLADHDITSDPSDSTPQREIEQIMLLRVGETHPDWHSQSWKEATKQLGLSAVWLESQPDGVWQTRDAVLICECYARIGELKSGHRRKLAMDALKLIALRHQFAPQSKVRCALIVTEEMNAQLVGGWFAEALRLVEIIPVALTDPEKERLVAATERQADGQARRRKSEK